MVSCVRLSFFTYTQFSWLVCFDLSLFQTLLLVTFSCSWPFSSSLLPVPEYPATLHLLVATLNSFKATVPWACFSYTIAQPCSWLPWPYSSYTHPVPGYSYLPVPSFTPAISNYKHPVPCCPPAPVQSCTIFPRPVLTLSPEVNKLWYIRCTSLMQHQNHLYFFSYQIVNPFNIREKVENLKE